MENLIIVESPTKAKTISKFVGNTYRIEPSYGHIRDLPKSELGIDIKNNFSPRYIIPRKAKSRVSILKKAASKAKSVILATDEDREGEAIAWHITKIIDGGNRNIKRIVFHEITKNAIEQALKKPRSIDLNLVNAQQARRVLDRLVGYKLSPFLWEKIAKRLSAGRVQSVALRLIIDREEEIREFKPEDYWSISAVFSKDKIDFPAELKKINGKNLEKLSIKTEKRAKELSDSIKKSKFSVISVENKETKKNPPPPFITSTLQQTAATLLGFSAKKTMYLAQSLYENGYITYMRTDSVNIAKEAVNEAMHWVKSNLPPEYLIKKPRVFKTKSNLAQEAHECIRPTNIEREPNKAKLKKEEQKLYDIIWRRFISSQLPQAVFYTTKVEIEARNGKDAYIFYANGNIMKFDGFTKFWKIKTENKEIPKLAKGDKVDAKKITYQKHTTEPPPRYTEASLIKTLEKYGIGRPSTYAPIISVIQDRNYVEKINGKFHPTEIGEVVNKILTKNFPKIVDINFTAQMENNLDEVARGKIKWQDVIKNFYEPFEKNLEEKYKTVSKEKIEDEKTDEKCELCGKPMVVKYGRYGKFLACSGFPKCKNTKPLGGGVKRTGIPCPKCGKGELVERKVNKRGRSHGKIFWGCSRYPECDYATWEKPN